jgi:hypothetical protein
MCFNWLAMLQAKRAQVAERKKRKEENELKSLVVQKVRSQLVLPCFLKAGLTEGGHI